MTLNRRTYLNMPRGRHGRRSGTFHFAFLLTIVSTPGMAAPPPTPHISPLCAAYIASDQLWAEQRLSANHRLTADAKRKLDAQVAQEDQKNLCDMPYFPRRNRNYVAQRHKWRRRLAKAYQSLSHQLYGSARMHLARDEQRWAGYHARELQNPENSVNQYIARVTRLHQLAQELSVGPYPFISDHVIIKNAFFRSGATHADVHYPQFDNGGIDAATTDRFFAHAARSAVNKFNRLAAQVFANPLPPGARFPVTYDLSQWFTLNRPNPVLVDIDLTTSEFTGGAGEYGGEHSYLIDLRTDRLVSLQQIFQPGTNWQHRLTHIVSLNFQHQLGERGSKYISHQVIVQTLQHPSNYFFTRNSLDIDLDYNWPIRVFQVKVPYAQIRSLLRPHGLLAVTPNLAPSRKPH